MLHYLTAGESHGACLTAIIEGLPAGIPIDQADINRHLARRQAGYGRGGRMKIENDKVIISAGIRGGYTLGSPITLSIMNKDWENWRHIMSSAPDAQIEDKKVTHPRPGHADLAGGIKYNQRDLRSILERSSARETAARVAVGAVCMQFLAAFDVFITSHVVQIGGIRIKNTISDIKEIAKLAEESPVRCVDNDATKKMMQQIDLAKKQGDSLGGVFEVRAGNIPIGLGSHVHWERKLDARLSYGLMSIQAIKGVEVGLGFECAERFGSRVHDEIYYDFDNQKFYHKTNHAGGIEGGMSNGEDIILRAVMKPIPTLLTPLDSVDINTKKTYPAAKERSDTCAVPAAAVVGEAVVAYELSCAMIDKFGGDSLSEMMRNYKNYLAQVEKY